MQPTSQRSPLHFVPGRLGAQPALPPPSPLREAALPTTTVLLAAPLPPLPPSAAAPPQPLPIFRMTTSINGWESQLSIRPYLPQEQQEALDASTSPPTFLPFKLLGSAVEVVPRPDGVPEWDIQPLPAAERSFMGLQEEEGEDLAAEEEELVRMWLTAGTPHPPALHADPHPGAGALLSAVGAPPLPSSPRLASPSTSSRPAALPWGMGGLVGAARATLFVSTTTAAWGGGSGGGGGGESGSGGGPNGTARMEEEEGRGGAGSGSV